MKNSWYYRFLVVVGLLVVVVNLQAQSNDFLQNSDLQRKGFKLAIDTPNGTNENEASMVVLKKEQLQTMLSYSQFESYKNARYYYRVSIPLLSLAACGIIPSAYFLVAGIIAKNNRSLALPLSGILFAGTLPFLVSGIVLMTHSAKRLNGIAEDYNKQRQTSHFQNGLQVNFGLVDNGIGMKLRF